MARFGVTWLVLLGLGLGTSRAGEAPELQSARGVVVRPWYPVAPALAEPVGEVIRVEDVEGLFKAVERVSAGGTIVLAEGVYRLGRTLVVSTDRVTLRGASGDRRRVVLDGGGTLGEGLTIRSCEGVTIADLTVQNVRWNGIKLDSDRNVQKVTIRNCLLHNIWQRAVKGVKVPEEGRERTRPRDCVIEYCLFANDRPKRFADDPADTAANFDGNYIGGIDVMYPSGWVIRDNVFVGIKGRTGSARGAIFLWHDARDCVVERNVIVDCDSGICLGNSSLPAGVTTHATGILARNNMLCRVPENGILAAYTKSCAILSNTVHDPESRLGRLIRVVHENHGLGIMNNLLSGPPLLVETPGEIDTKANVSGDFGSLFISPAEGNLRLSRTDDAVVDRAIPLPEVMTDFDGHPRGDAPDVGAHEFPKP